MERRRQRWHPRWVQGGSGCDTAPGRSPGRGEAGRAGLARGGDPVGQGPPGGLGALRSGLSSSLGKPEPDRVESKGFRVAGTWLEPASSAACLWPRALVCKMEMMWTYPLLLCLGAPGTGAGMPSGGRLVSSPLALSGSSPRQVLLGSRRHWREVTSGDLLAHQGWCPKHPELPQAPRQAPKQAAVGRRAPPREDSGRPRAARGSADVAGELHTQAATSPLRQSPGPDPHSVTSGSR